MRRGDVFAVPVWQGRPIPEAEDGASSDSDEEGETVLTSSMRPLASELVYFKVTTLNYEPLMALEDDFRSSLSSKGRSGELGCWVDIGDEGTTQLTLEGLERDRVTGRDAAKAWHCVGESRQDSNQAYLLTRTARHPVPYDRNAAGRLGDLLLSCMARSSLASVAQLSILIKGARGSGTRSMLAWIADEVGLNIVQVSYECPGDIFSSSS